MSNKSEKKEKLEPQDSERKGIEHPEDDNEAVVKEADLTYNKDDVNFGNTARKKENSEQPVHPVKSPPKE